MVETIPKISNHYSPRFKPWAMNETHSESWIQQLMTYWLIFEN